MHAVVVQFVVLCVALGRLGVAGAAPHFLRTADTSSRRPGPTGGAATAPAPAGVQNQFGFNISILLAVYYETSFLLEILTLQKEYISELVIVDGPRRNSTALLAALGVLYSEDTSPVKTFVQTELADAFPDLSVRYLFRIWDDEKTQRDAGFDLCTGPVVMMADADMPMRLHHEAVAQFVHSDTGSRGRVAGVTVTTLVEWGVASSKAHPKKTGPAKHHVYRQNVMTNKLRIDADRFFDYLSIVGSRQRGRDQSDLFPPPVGAGDHYTVLRTINGTIAKYAFYFSMHNPQSRESLLTMITQISSRWGYDIARQVFARGFDEGLCLLNTARGLALVPLPRTPYKPTLVHSHSAVCTHAYLSRDSRLAVTPHRHSMALLPSNRWSRVVETGACFNITNVMKGRISVWSYNMYTAAEEVLGYTISPDHTVSASGLRLTLPRFNESTYAVMLRVTSAELVEADELLGFVEECVW